MLGPDRKCFFFLSDSDLQIPISKNGLQLWRTALWLRQDCLLSNDRSDSLRVPKYMKNYFGFAHASSFPLYEGQLFYWSIMTAVDSIKCRCAHSGMTGQVDRFQNPGVSVSPSASSLSSPPPLRSFTYAIFARSLTLVPRSLLLNRTETLATQAMNEDTYEISSIKRVSRCSRAKPRQRNVQRKCAAHAKLLLC